MASTLARSSRCLTTFAAAGPSAVALAAASSSSSSSSSQARLAAVKASGRTHSLPRSPMSIYRPFSSSTIRNGLAGNTIEFARQDFVPPPVANSLGGDVRSRRERRDAKKAQKKARKAKKEGKTLAAQMGLNQSKLSPLVRIDRQFKTFKPITPSIRWLRYNLNPHLHKGDPIKQLTIAKRGTGGRNHHGHITVRGRGGGHKRRLRMVDFWRWEEGTQTVVRIEYDPGRSAHIALIKHSETGRVSYILAPDGLRAGDEVRSYRTMKDLGSGDKDAASSALDMGIFRTQAVRPGNVLPLHLIPVGTMIHAVSLVPHGPAKLIRSAGSSGRLVAFVNRSKATKSPSSAQRTVDDMTREAAASALDTVNATNEDIFETIVEDAGSQIAERTTHAQIRLQSGEVRLVTTDCIAAIGRVSNVDHKHRRLGKAGRSRWLGRRPKVRGIAMNKVDHPHGGGRGKSKSNMHPKSIYGHKAEGRTRKPGTRTGNKMVVKERPRQLGARKKK